MGDSVQLFKALADETRLRILNLLIQKELCVCQVVQALDIGQSKASRHLAVLKNAGLVQDRRDGSWTHYSLARPTARLQRQIVQWLAEAGDEIPSGGADFRRLAALDSCGDACVEDAIGEKDEEFESETAVRSAL